MPAHRIRSQQALPLDLDGIRRDLEVPGPFPEEALAEADRAAGRTFPDHEDATHLDLVTIDPPGSRDLDQALAIDAVGDGWRVSYAIADVAAWLEPGGAIDAAARSRTQTYYAPDRRIPLHPPVLGEGAASLLPDGPRPAVLWTIDVAADGSFVITKIDGSTVAKTSDLHTDGVPLEANAMDTQRTIACLAFPDVMSLDVTGPLEAFAGANQQLAAPGYRLVVAELDAIDGTPVLDIKPVMAEFLPRQPVRQPDWARELMREYWSDKKA